MLSLPKTLPFVAAGLALLTGCDTVDPYVGSGPIALGPTVRQAFTDYRAKTYPRYFAVAEDGRAFYYNYCPDGACPRTPKSSVVAQCETFSEGVPCKIYASNGKIVWADDGP